MCDVCMCAVCDVCVLLGTTEATPQQEWWDCRGYTVLPSQQEWWDCRGYTVLPSQQEWWHCRGYTHPSRNGQAGDEKQTMDNTMNSPQHLLLTYCFTALPTVNSAHHTVSIMGRYSHVSDQWLAPPPPPNLPFPSLPPTSPSSLPSPTPHC